MLVCPVSVLPCLSDQHNKTDIFETAARTKDKLLSLLTETQGEYWLDENVARAWDENISGAVLVEFMIDKGYDRPGDFETLLENLMKKEEAEPDSLRFCLV